MKTKQLSPLEAFEKLKQLFKEFEKALKYSTDFVVVDKTLFPIIEATLKENAELKQMIRNFNEAIGEPQIITPTAEKKLKALEIIKEKGVAVDELIRCIKECGENALEEYNNFAGDKNSLTQEEYDLLKEVLL